MTITRLRNFFITLIVVFIAFCLIAVVVNVIQHPARISFGY